MVHLLYMLILELNLYVYCFLFFLYIFSSTHKTHPSSSFAGCFFAQQHSLVTNFEELYLKNQGAAITSICGYAGGQMTSPLCYPNSKNIGVYDVFGHAEAVQTSIPKDENSMYEAFKVYFKSFVLLGMFKKNFLNKYIYI